MIELPMVFLAGILGSAHCLGMCGPFVLAIGSGATSWRANLTRQLIYSLGRLFTYGTLGAMAGFGGWRLAKAFPVLVNVPALLAILAGGLLIYQGLAAAGLLRRWQRHSGTPCLAGTFFATLLMRPGLGGAFLAGLFTGLLPWGLVYAMLALAGSSRDMLAGLTTMCLFGLGTIPVMVLTGCGGSLLGAIARQRLYYVAAWCVVLTGAVSITRGLGFVQIPGWFAAAGCPYCP